MSTVRRGETIGNYSILETVGHGTFGEVMLAVERHTRESVAIKVLERKKIADDEARQRLANEVAILQRVHHTNLLQLLEVIEDVDCIYLVTEYVGGGELFTYIVDKGRLDEAEAARLFMQMVSAVDCCHRNLVIHRDLKVRARRLRSPCMPTNPDAQAAVRGNASPEACAQSAYTRSRAATGLS